MKTNIKPTFGIEIDWPTFLRLDNWSATNMLLENKLILIRDLKLTPDELIQIGKKFGNLFKGTQQLKGNNEENHIESSDRPEITVLKRDGLHANNIIEWHTDLIHRPADMLPGRALYAHDIDPSMVSTTSWADLENGAKLYKQSPSLEDVLCVYAADYKTSWTGAVRKMLNKHHITGKTCLMVDDIFTRCIMGMTIEDTEFLKKTILSKILVPDNVYTHTWKTGDLIIYDNNSTIHSRDMRVSGEGNRTLWRLTFDFDIE